MSLMDIFQRKQKPKPEQENIESLYSNVDGLKMFLTGTDGFVNPATHTGQFADNLFSYGEYQFNNLTYKWQFLNACYRTDWLVGKIVDSVAEDMTRAGITITGIDEVEKIYLEAKFSELNILNKLNEMIKWARLFGGAFAMFMIDGQELDEPFNLNYMAPNAFKGLYIFDRWALMPNMTDFVTDYGRHFGESVDYEVLETSSCFQGKKIHYTRGIKAIGIELPHWMKTWEYGWGESVVERVWDVLRAFASVTQGSAQLVYQTRLWTLYKKGLTQILGGTSSSAQNNLFKSIQEMLKWRNNEGLSVLDSEDRLDQQIYTFSGVDDIMQQFVQQVSGSCGIPITRLMGQSPKGFSSGDMEIRQYYDSIHKDQEKYLREPLHTILKIIYRSYLYKDAPSELNFEFNPLWNTDEHEHAEIFSMRTDAVINAFNAGVITSEQALKQLHAGGWESITPQDIEEVNNEPPPITELEGVKDNG